MRVIGGFQRYCLSATSAGGTEGTLSDSERRTKRRYDIRLRAVCFVGAETYKAWTLNLSAEGISLITRSSFPHVQSFRVACRLDSGKKAEFYVQVANRESLMWRNQMYVKLGLKVLRRPHEAEAFFKELDQMNGKDQTFSGPDFEEEPSELVESGERKERRVMRRQELALETRVRIGAQTFIGKTVDIGARGLGLLVKDELPEAEGYLVDVWEQERGFSLRVEEKYRRRETLEDGSYIRLGLAVLKASPNFKKFLQAHHLLELNDDEALSNTQKLLKMGVQALETHAKEQSKSRLHLQLPLLAEVGAKTFRGHSIFFTPKGLRIMVGDDFPVVPTKPIRFEYENGSVSLQVEEKSRESLVTPAGRLLRIDARIIAAGEDYAAFLKEHGLVPAGPMPAHHHIVDQAADIERSDPEHDERRQHRRVFAALRVFAKVGEGIYRGRSQDFSVRGLCFLAPVNLPKLRFYLLKCRFGENDFFRLKVEEKYRETKHSQEGSYYRIGLKIIDADPAFKMFLQQKGLLVVDGEVGLGRMPRKEPTGPVLPASVSGDPRFSYVKHEGGSSFGELFQVRDGRLAKSVVLQVFASRYLLEPSIRDFIVEEGRRVSELRHENILGLYEAGEVTAGNYDKVFKFPRHVLRAYPERILYYEMEMTTDRSLEHWFLQQIQVPQMRLLEVLYDIARALDHAHQKGVYHLDLRPSSIYLGENGTVRVANFGIARVVDLMAKSELETTGSMNSSYRSFKLKFLSGPPLYMAPEQLSGDMADGRADIYALGVIAYQAIAGRVPFSGRNWMQLVNKHLTAEPPELKAADPRLNPRLESLILRCLEKKPEHRFSDAQELAVEIRMVMRTLQAG